MRRTTLLMLSMVGMVLVLAGGVALAATVDCTAGAAECVGTPGPDTINGAPDSDDMYGLAGADRMSGNDGEDYVQGDRGADRLFGGDDADSLWGGAHKDDDGPLDDSDDVVRGGPGADYIWSGFARQGSVDRVFGEEGNDTVEAERRYGYPKTKDVVDCGPGVDTVYFDRGLDKVANNCERKRPGKPPGNPPAEMTAPAPRP